MTIKERIQEAYSNFCEEEYSHDGGIEDWDNIPIVYTDYDAWEYSRFEDDIPRSDHVFYRLTDEKYVNIVTEFRGGETVMYYLYEDCPVETFIEDLESAEFDDYLCSMHDMFEPVREAEYIEEAVKRFRNGSIRVIYVSPLFKYDGDLLELEDLQEDNEYLKTRHRTYWYAPREDVVYSWLVDDKA